MVIWIIGLSGSGKSTLGHKIFKKVKRFKDNIIIIDGDEFRKVMNNDLGYSLNDRKINAQRIARFCKFCDNQGIHVICPILSIFPEIRAWNRKNIKHYYEIFIETDIETLKKRDSKGIYKKYKNKKIKNVVGLDIKFPLPRNSDLVIKNNKSLKTFTSYSDLISEIILKK